MTTATGKLFNRDYICVLINVVCMNLGFNMLSTIVTPYALTLGATLTGAGLVTGVMSIAAMCVRPFTGITSDMLSPRKLLFAGALGTVAVIFGCSALDDVRILFALRIVHGILFSMRAGNDLIMPGTEADISEIRKAVQDGVLTVEDVQSCAGHLIKTIRSLTEREERGEA